MFKVGDVVVLRGNEKRKMTVRSVIDGTDTVSCRWFEELEPGVYDTHLNEAAYRASALKLAD